MEDFTFTGAGGGRHLVWDATNENTICGLRIGLVVWHQLKRVKVHWSKARRSDCRVCRMLVRESIRESRRQRDGGPPYDAATATGMYDPEGT